MPYNGCSQMLHISLKTEKSFIAHPSRLLCIVGLEEYSAQDWRAATSGIAPSSNLARVEPVIETDVNQTFSLALDKQVKNNGSVIWDNKCISR